MNHRKPLIFLDRDGTINVDHGYVTQPQRVELIPGAAQALGDLTRGGYRLVVVSNQSAVGRGMATIADVDATNSRLQELLLQKDPDARLDLVLYATDHPGSAGDDRKPGTGLLRLLPREWGFQPRLAWMIGDKWSDIEFGHNAGLSAEQCLLVQTGEGQREWSTIPEERRHQQLHFADLRSAADFILSGHK
ncbi:MAG: HAD-IIIA family hydrolase [Bdellovibrionales bacterium]|nr:HAD-IIIA family hydrolase [Bdellovibrionales bacterium]